MDNSSHTHAKITNINTNRIKTYLLVYIRFCQKIHPQQISFFRLKWLHYSQRLVPGYKEFQM